jgi:membrane protein/epoxyqueuosine reductase
VPVVLSHGAVAYGLFKLASIPFTILILFLVYWKLPNTKVPALKVLPRAAVIGLLLEMLKWINWFIWPWLFAKFQREYGVFRNSVTILVWSYFASLIVLAGADWSARRARAAEAAAVPETSAAAPLEAMVNPGPAGGIV